MHHRHSREKQIEINKIVSRERRWTRTNYREKNELAKEAKDIGARGATDEADEGGGARSNSTEDSGEHRKENTDG